MAKILIIDDDALNSGLYVNKLTSQGYEVDYAADGKKAQEYVKNQYDLIVLDVMMPKVDGVSLLGLLRKGTNKRTPVIIYTNLTGKEIQDQVGQFKNVQYLHKSAYTPRTFIGKVEEMVEKH